MAVGARAVARHTTPRRLRFSVAGAVSDRRLPSREVWRADQGPRPAADAALLVALVTELIALR